MEYEDLVTNILEYLRIKYKSIQNLDRQRTLNTLYHSVRGYRVEVDGEQLLELSEKIFETVEEYARDEIYEELKKEIKSELNDFVKKAELDIRERLKKLSEGLVKIVS